MVKKFEGCIPPIVTPFDKDGEINESILRREMEYCMKAGSHGLSVGGSTGEGPTLRDEELARMLQIGREYVGPDQTLVCGVMRMCTRDAVRTGLVAKEAGAGAISAILAVFPKECVEMWECAQRGDHARGLEIQASLYKKWQVLGGNQFPIRLKYALQVMGRDCGYCRSPITYLPEDEKKAIRETVEN